jgi:hypothetical protein
MELVFPFLRRHHKKSGSEDEEQLEEEEDDEEIIGGKRKVLFFPMKKIKLVVFSRLKKYQKLNSYHPHLCGGRCCCDVFIIVGIVEE